MLSPQDLLQIIDTMYPLIDKLNYFITDDIISRMMARLGRGEAFLLTGTDQWQLEVYKAAGGHLEALQQKIKAFTKKSEAEIKEIFEAAGIRSWNNDNDFYVKMGLPSQDFKLSETMQKILSDEYQRTLGEIQNFTRTTAKASQKRLINAMDIAHLKVLTGAQSYTQAVKDAVNEIAGEQTSVQYPTGHIDTIETAILRAVRTGTAQACGNLSMQEMVERDWDLIRVSAHLGARYGDGGENPGNHFYWQGGLYSRTGLTKGYLPFVGTTGYGTGEGLCGWNCRHSFGPGDPNHNPYKDFNAEENKQAFDLSQKQRTAEARIRSSKLKLLGLRGAINRAEDKGLKATLQSDYDKAATLLYKRNAALNKLCEDNGLKKLSDRINVAKWNRTEAMKAVAAAKRYNKK